MAAAGDYACDAAAHLGKVLLAKRDGVEERGGRHHESVDDVRLGDVLLELLVLDALHVIVVEALAGALARRSIDEVVVGVIEDQVGARRAADVDEEDVEDDAEVHGDVRRARLAVDPPVDAQVAESELRREELARRDPVDAPALVPRNAALALAVGGREGVRGWRGAWLRKPRAALVKRRLILLDHAEQVVLDYLPQLLVNWAILPRQKLADEALDSVGQFADPRTLVDT